MKTIDTDDNDDVKNRDNLGDNRDADGESGKETNNEKAGDSRGDESGNEPNSLSLKTDSRNIPVSIASWNTIMTFFVVLLVYLLRPW